MSEEQGMLLDIRYSPDGRSMLITTIPDTAAFLTEVVVNGVRFERAVEKPGRERSCEGRIG